MAKNETHDELRMGWPFVGLEIHDHITYQETAAAADGIVHAVRARDYRMCTLATKVDATAAIKYIKSHGGKNHKFARRIWDMQSELRARRIYNGGDKDYGEFHVEGEKNTQADYESRKDLGPAEWKLNVEIFQWMQAKWGPFGIDMFAAAWNHQLPRYLCRQGWDRKAEGHDALQFPLNLETKVTWAHPPPHKRVTQRLLSLISTTSAEMMLIIPLWPTVETSMALKMAVHIPILLECSQHVLTPPESLTVHQHGEEFTHWAQTARWWINAPFKFLIGVRMSGKPEAQGVLARLWQQALNSSTNPDKTEAGVDILIDIGRSCAPISDRNRKAVLGLSQMLSCVT
jgi:hypothetical protein